MKFLKKTVPVFAALALLAAAGIGNAREQQCPDNGRYGNIVQVLQKKGHFTTLIKAVQAAGLESTLAGSGTYTVFAPTDEAFAKLPKGALEQLLNDPRQLRHVLLYHVSPGRYTADDLERETGATLPTAYGEGLPVSAQEKKLFVAHARVMGSGMKASNGVVYPINEVIIAEHYQYSKPKEQ